MVFPITVSSLPLEFDTLPALKCQFWQQPSCPVYTTARLYLLNGMLHLSLSAFERAPLPDSTLVFSLGNHRQQVQFYLSPQNSVFLVAPPTDPCPPSLGFQKGLAVSVQRFSGNDEQGWYWGAHAALPFGEADVRGNPGFTGGLAKYQGDQLQGASFHCAQQPNPFAIVEC